MITIFNGECPVCHEPYSFKAEKIGGELVITGDYHVCVELVLLFKFCRDRLNHKIYWYPRNKPLLLIQSLTDDHLRNARAYFRRSPNPDRIKILESEFLIRQLLVNDNPIIEYWRTYLL